MEQLEEKIKQYIKDHLTVKTKLRANGDGFLKVKVELRLDDEIISESEDSTYVD